MFGIVSPYQMDGLHIFLSFHRMPFHCGLLFPFHFSLIQSHLSIFGFISCTFGIKSKKSLPRPMSRSFPPPMVSLRNFIVSGLTYLIHFSLVFIYDVKQKLNFILLHVDMDFPKTIFFKEMILSHCNFCLVTSLPLQNSGELSLSP